MSVTLALKVQTRAEELERIFAAVEDLAEQEDWPPGLIFKVNLILEELGLNVIKYGYDGGLHDFDINLVSDQEAIAIEIIDSGRPFNPLEDSPQPNTDGAIEERPIGGLGVYLVREMSDDMQYRREHSKNHSKVVIRKGE